MTITARFDSACSEAIQHTAFGVLTPVDLPGIYARVARDCGVTVPEVQEAVVRRDQARGTTRQSKGKGK